MPAHGLDNIPQAAALVLQRLDDETGLLLVDPGPYRDDHLLLPQIALGDVERLLA